jgi:hypothetical protein
VLDWAAGPGGAPPAPAPGRPAAVRGAGAGAGTWRSPRPPAVDPLAGATYGWADTGGEWRLTVDGAPLEWTPAAARACLSHTPVLFVGDSLTRYTYLALVHFLHTGTWYPAAGTPSWAHPSFWGGWPEFQRGTNALLAGAELCDCDRNEAERTFYPGAAGADPPDPSSSSSVPAGHVLENRYYARAADAIKVAWLALWGDLALFGHDLASLSPPGGDCFVGGAPVCNQTRCAPAACLASPPDWVLPPDTGIADRAAALRPAVVVVNSGLWAPYPAARVTSIAAGVLAALPGATFFWRTTTAVRPGAQPPLHSLDTAAFDAAAADALAAQGDPRLRVFDAAAVVAPLAAPSAPGGPGVHWIDGAHPAAHAYRGLAEAFLAAMCGRPTPAPGGGGAGNQSAALA